MKKFLIALCFLLPFLAFGQKEQFIPWSEKRLTWNDYLAEPSDLSDAAAITSTALGFEYHIRNNMPTYKITCSFSKTRSWGKYKTDYILKHEQGHFDITEIYARKLAKALDEYKFNPKKYQQDLNKIYGDVMKEKEEFQNEYDDNTDYSRKKGKQSEWLERIATLLADLGDYRDYTVFTSIKKSLLVSGPVQNNKSVSASKQDKKLLIEKSIDGHDGKKAGNR